MPKPTKKNLLKETIEHIDITRLNVRKLVDSWRKMSFSSRDTANATDIYNMMLGDKKTTIWLTLAGSTSAGGCMQVYVDMVKNNMVDCIVATGASIVDMDFFEALGFKHYRGTPFINDGILRSLYIDRIYDTFIDESAGFGLVIHQEKHPENHLTIDSIKDFRELTEIKMKSKDTGLFMVGGGVPKNFAQDTVVCAEVLGKNAPVHKYAVQITVADVRDGACSSSTLKEAASWGKVTTIYEQMVYAEATTVVPIIAAYAYQTGNWKKRKKPELAKLFN